MTECTGHIGNAFGPKAFSSGSKTRVPHIAVSQIMIHNAEQPDVAAQVPYADGLSGKEVEKKSLCAQASAFGAPMTLFWNAYWSAGKPW